MADEIKVVPVKALKLYIEHKFDMQDIMDILPCHLLDMIDEMPTLTYVEPKRGEWIRVRVGPYQHTYGMRCSHCDATYMLSFECEEYFKAKAESTHYCSNCGADMRGEKE